MTETVLTFSPDCLTAIFHKEAQHNEAPAPAPRYQRVIVAVDPTPPCALVSFAVDEGGDMTITGIEYGGKFDSPSVIRTLLFEHVDKLLQKPDFAGCAIEVAVDCSLGSDPQVCLKLMERKFAATQRVSGHSIFFNSAALDKAVQYLRLDINALSVRFAENLIGEQKDAKDRLREQLCRYCTCSPLDGVRRYRIARATYPESQVPLEDNLVWALLIGAVLKHTPCSPQNTIENN